MTEKKTQKYAIVDLEATGAHQSATIIQVGIVIVENDQIVTTYQTDVNPHEPLSQHIIELTGITDEQLQEAPDFPQVAGEIYELIADCIFVAHNVAFDANLLAEHLFLEGFELRTPRIDTVELAQVFYPTLEKYSLSHLAQALHLDLSDAHTAIADAKATAQLFLNLKQKIRSLPKLTLEKLLSLANDLVFETSLVIEEAFECASLELEDCYQEVAGLVLKKPQPLLEQRQFSQDFKTNLALLGLEKREKQALFAEVIAEELEKEGPSFIEAQAGIGKTFGYLLPLLIKARECQVILAVPTKMLQDQVMAKEAKLLETIFHLNSSSLKSPQNYIKLDRFLASLQRPDANRLVNRYKMQLLVWLTQTETGDLDEIQQKQRYEAYFDEIKHDGKLSDKSLTKSADFWLRSYERAKQSKLVITNHAYLLSRLEDDQAFVANQMVVIDEAQKLFLAWEAFSRHQVNLTSILQTINQLLNGSLSLLQRRLLESIQFELNQVMATALKTSGHLIKSANIKRLRQDLAELDVVSTDLLELKNALADHMTSFWLEEERLPQHRQLYLKSASLDFMNFAAFLPPTQKTFFISATLQLSPSVSLAELLGFQNQPLIALAKETSDQQAIWIDSTMPIIESGADKAYVLEVSRRLLGLAKLQQPMLVLFTAKKMMLAVSERLDQEGLSHLTQDKNGNAFNIKKRFDRGETNLLLGMGSFWEGVDFINQDRMIVVIARLPFDHPDDFLVKKMNRYLRKQGQSPFYQYSLPVAILRLKQAIGRTKRREQQQSAVLILDSRLVMKPYGQLIVDTLAEEYPISSQVFTQIISEIDNFLI